jgi:uncharacterized lipoprotein YddW (UPF0748 family)
MLPMCRSFAAKPGAAALILVSFITSICPAQPAGNVAEVRGTWITTTANEAIASPEHSARTMKQLADIGLNTVYVECWKNGYTQFPSQTLKRTIGVDRRPALMPQDPSDRPDALKTEGRDLLQETLIEAHRNGLVYVAWFEYGFMAAHKSTDNHLRRMKKEWLSLDKDGNEVAPNGFVWMNPLHPDARRFLLDLVLEAADAYDLDGVQLDDRIVWPYLNMGYDAYTRKVYAAEHDGREPPADPKDPEWFRWRVEKVNEYAKIFTQEIRAAHPGLTVSLSPAVYPWCYENYLLEWPKWAAWTPADRYAGGGSAWSGHAADMPRWDEFIPQCYRMNYKAYEQTWLDQVRWMKELGGGRVRDLIAGIRVVGDGPDATWPDVKASMDLVRSTGGGGHVHWFSRGVLDLYPKELTAYYDIAQAGRAPHPKFGADWRRPAIPLEPLSDEGKLLMWGAKAVPPGRYRVIVDTGEGWRYGPIEESLDGAISIEAADLPGAKRVEVIVDRRADFAGLADPDKSRKGESR